MQKFSCRHIKPIINFFVLFPNLSQDLFLLLFIPAVHNAFLAFEPFQSFTQSQKIVGRLFVHVLCFLDRARVFFVKLCFELINMFFGLVTMLVNLIEFFESESFYVTTRVFVDFFDIMFGKDLFVFLYDVLFDVVVAIEANGFISETRSAAHLYLLIKLIE